MKANLIAAGGAILAAVAVAGVLIWQSTKPSDLDRAAQGLNDAIQNANSAMGAAGDYTGYITITQERSRCLVNETAGVITFRITVHNADSIERLTTIRPVVRLAGGGLISRGEDDRFLTIPAGADRQVATALAYNRKRHPKECRVTIRNGGEGGSIAMRQTTLMA